MLQHGVAMFSIASNSSEDFGPAVCRRYPGTCTACPSVARNILTVSSASRTSLPFPASSISVSTAKYTGTVSPNTRTSIPFSTLSTLSADTTRPCSCGSCAISQSASTSLVYSQTGAQSSIYSPTAAEAGRFNRTGTQSGIFGHSDTQSFASNLSSVANKALTSSFVHISPGSQSLECSQSNSCATVTVCCKSVSSLDRHNKPYSPAPKKALSVIQRNEGQSFWRGFEDNSSQSVNTTQDPGADDDDSHSSENAIDSAPIESTASTARDSDANMAAMASNRKLCKLDAICAKLKSKGPSSVAETLGQDTDNKHADDDDCGGDDEPTDLSTKCLNNNIIGKVDLQRIELVQDAAAENTNHIGDSPTPNQTSAEINKTADNEGEKVDSVLNLSANRDNSYDRSKLLPVRKVETFHSTGSSRRKSRKASTPRNITQVRDLYSDNIDDKDELADYEINNLNTNFPPEENEDPEYEAKDNGANIKASFTNNTSEYIDHENSSHSSALNHSKSSSSLNQSTNSKRSTLSSDISDVFDDSAPLDLSVSKSYEYDNEDSSDNEEYAHNDRSLVIDEDKPSISRANSPVEKRQRREVGGEQAAHLKDYAESTMNELISMYGFGGSLPTDISKHIPVNNFKQMFHSNMLPLTSLPASTHVVPSKKPKLSIDSESDDGSQHAKSFMSSFNLGMGNQAKPEGNVKLQNDRFTSSSSFINAVYNSNSNPGAAEQLLKQKTLLPNYSKYLKRYNNGNECGGQHCNDLNYKEHYHCIDCSFQVFIKKEEMVRHYKWHKKREESLQHGFLRFSPLDNCTKRFGPCTHNRKQTHYHCLQKGCDKVYISTSDVQMHANYHRKDSAIMSEGFQRFRATEDCGTQSCAFYGQRTTHFHCLRQECKFTFKNKADMEKHKSYHQKDEVLGRDGFKKFMKYEHCHFQGCRYSKLSNHIHCIRAGCDYILHSTAQLYSHKRKHERRDFETAYKHFRTNQPPTPSPNPIPNKMMIPRNDFGSGSIGLAQSSNLNLKPAVQAVPTSVIQARMDLKRPLSRDNSTEPMELKKPKIEPKSEVNSDVDRSATSSPVGSSLFGRSSPHGKGGFNESTMEDNASDFSDYPYNEDHRKHLDSSSYDEDSIDLNDSLSLQIPLLHQKNGLGTSSSSHSEDSKQPISLPQLPSALSSVNSALPGTLPGSLVSMMNSGTLMTVPSTLTGASTVLQPPKSVYNERREKDDSWKTYLVRYTANDPCNPRCQYLYKDHYHCKMDGCLVLFKSKDGVREHARFHELQDRITPIAYKEYAQTDACPEACQYSETEKHYHCIWTGCTHVVPYIGPTFGRLEHYRIHEYARAAAGKAYSRSGRGVAGGLDDNQIRRRGRPPKYPKIELPRIPKVELTDEEIQQSHTQTKNSEVLVDKKVVNGFRVFNAEDPCPDGQCSYIGRLHYHCARPRCFTITDRVDVLNLHAKDFHSYVKILEGYEFFDRNVSCRRASCPNNQVNRHFHCTRPKCDYSFIRHSTMSQHEKKHGLSENGSYLGRDVQEKPLSPTLYRRDVPIRPAIHTSPGHSTSAGQVTPANSTIKADTGSYPSIKPNLIPNIPMLFPISQGSIIIPQSAALIQQPNMVSSNTVAALPIALPISTIQALPPYVTSSHLVPGVPNPLVTSANTEGATSQPEGAGPTAPLTVLLQRGINQIPQPSWMEIKAKMHYALSQNCGRPFCKLKKKDHYHCYDCNQAFSDPARLRSHIGKHGIKFKKGDIAAQPFTMIAPNTDAKEAGPSPNCPDDIENGEMDPDEAQCLAQGVGNHSDSESDEDTKSSSLNLNPSTFSEMISKAQEQNKLSDFSESPYHQDEEAPVDYSRNTGSPDTDNSVGLSLDLSSRSGRKITKTKHDGFMNSGDINLSKQRQVGSPKGAMGMKPGFKTSEPVNHKPQGGTIPGGPPIPRMKDDSVPNGYSRWKYNEECNYPKCAYRHSVTHFHCNRVDCGYGFSDRSRLVQHSLRHERIDSITGGELQQYRINQDCEEPSCEFNKKMSHFHCKRCVYNCTDSSKVLTHRKYHAKLDSIASQGFQKYSASEDCGISVCAYMRKQTHFHCLVDTCRAAVLGVNQMNSHKSKHVANNIHYATVST